MQEILDWEKKLKTTKRHNFWLSVIRGNKKGPCLEKMVRKLVMWRE